MPLYRSSGGAGSLSLVGVYAPSAAATVDIDNFAGLTDVGQILISIENLVASADSIGINATFKLNGTYKTASYIYGHEAFFVGAGAKSLGTSTSAASVPIYLTGAGGMGNAAGEGGSGMLRLLNPFDTAGRKRMSYYTCWIDDQATPRLVEYNGIATYGGVDFASALEGIRLTASSGTFSGDIQVYSLATI